MHCIFLLHTLPLFHVTSYLCASSLIDIVSAADLFVIGGVLSEIDTWTLNAWREIDTDRFGIL